MTLVDTDVLIDYLLGAEPMASKVAKLVATGQLVTSSVNCFELLCGAQENKRADVTRAFVSVVDVLTLDKLGAEKAAEVRRDLQGAGQDIGMGDSLIAGIALAYDLPLLTRNQKHFQRVKNLRLA